MIWRSALGAMLILLSGCGTPAELSTTPSKMRACDQVGTWLDPRTGEAIAPGPLMASLARRSVVLLGEQHDNAEHHRWQLQMLAALHAHNSNLIVGFEMFPRRVQAALNRWSEGLLDRRAFLKESDWQNVWGFDPDLYMPLFHFVRQNRLSMVGLNVDRALISKVGREGWAAIPKKDRGGLSVPAAASDGYLNYLASVFSNNHGRSGTHSKKADPESIKKNDGFKRFVAAQLTWDRAMAEAIPKARRKKPESLVVGIMGEGHARFGYGVPHQLTDLGVPNTAILLPVEPAAACKGLPATIADAVFVVAPPKSVTKPSPRPRLGVRLRNTSKGVLITQVGKGSVAASSGLVVSDVVISAAGRPIKTNSEFIAIVRRQAPGTWLPVTIRRKGTKIELVAKFPTKFK